MGLRIQRGLAQDVPGIAAVQLAASLTGFEGIFPSAAPKPTLNDLEEEWRHLLTDHTAVVFVADLDGIVGCASLSRTAATPAGCLLGRLYVHPDYWGQRIGKSLHDAALSACRGFGGSSINLWVLEGNARARGIYEHWGWRLIPATTQTIAIGAVVEVMYEYDMEHLDQ